MTKTRRGKAAIDKDGARKRGRCPVCDRTGVRLVYENAEKQTVCKLCRERKR